MIGFAGNGNGLFAGCRFNQLKHGTAVGYKLAAFYWAAHIWMRSHIRHTAVNQTAGYGQLFIIKRHIKTDNHKIRFFFQQRRQLKAAFNNGFL